MKGKKVIWLPKGTERKCKVTKEAILTQGDQVPVVLQHDVPMQSPLCMVQAFPFLLRELNGHITECQLSLKGNRHILPC